MTRVPQPPVPTDGEIKLSHLRRYARIFDEITPPGEHYSASDFVAWFSGEVKLESRMREGTRRYHAPAGRPGQMKAAVA